ncbi:MFS transporter [Oerskovia jenensis]|uniref:MFS family permease n=1 Tax=Oerskovia jenensis TaxID=162169 RepID=A0ABS2LE48_9CELL|nr:MFS transporter [Oerskovia jenensis]MBM7478592.1 MFS family permease [Oerskovia jenensis]
MSETPLFTPLENRSTDRHHWADITRLVSMQALFYGVLSVDLTLTALAGLALAPTPLLATLPLTLMVGAGLLAAVLTGLLVARWGYRRVMAAGAGLAVIGGLLSALAVVQHSFPLLCVGTALVGAYTATGGYVRFLAADLAPEGKQERALSTVMYGGLLAAFAGPFTALAASHAFETQFVGSYLLVATIGAVAIPLALSVSREPTATAAVAPDGQPAASPVRALAVAHALKNPDFVAALVILPVAAALMTLVMAIGPLASTHAGHSETTSTAMIQWHLVGMFAPAVFSGELLRRWGPSTATMVGAVVMLAGAVLGAISSEALPMIFTLSLVGIGWNLLFLAGSAFLLRCYERGAGGRLQALVEGVTGSASVLASLGAAVVFQTLGWQASNVPGIVLSAALLVWAALRAATAGRRYDTSTRALTA